MKPSRRSRPTVTPEKFHLTGTSEEHSMTTSRKVALRCSVLSGRMRDARSSEGTGMDIVFGRSLALLIVIFGAEASAPWNRRKNNKKKSVMLETQGDNDDLYIQLKVE